MKAPPFVHTLTIAHSKVIFLLVRVSFSAVLVFDQSVHFHNVFDRWQLFLYMDS